ncbi:MAG: hypothetical protein LBT25_08300 [Candidatus Symbiothrix sp.]|jgi:hypothetical protein|nr:hypothetical protein [Candidatus Symbiothrix sp.]
MKKILIIKLSVIGIILFSSNCFGQITKENMKTKDKELIGIKRRPDTISIESPILALLDIKKNEKGIFAHLTLMNTSDKNVMIDKNKLGGDKLRNHIFHLNPWYTKPNLSFNPYDSLFLSNRIKEEYIVLKPQEVIKTQTNLSKYYDFKERNYEIIDIIYLAKMKYLDDNYQQIMKKDIDNEVKPVEFSIESNRVKLEYKDIVN